MKVAPETGGRFTKERPSICRIAILPFVNESRKPEASLQVYRIFLNELVASGQYIVEPEGEVRLFLTRNRLFPQKLMDASIYAEFARQLQVDAVIRGKVIDYDMKEIQGSEIIPHLTLQIEIFEARSGRMLLNTFHRRNGNDYQTTLHFGTVKTMSGLVARVTKEIYEDWLEKEIGGCR
ncbi:MAG: hypothetical protein JW786_03290 [Desulfobacterales bacterium]|nr:hypothetical protein [Desulfobacterales bacterium]